MGQIATKVAEIDQRTTNTLPSNTISNPREECKVITLVSGPVIVDHEKYSELPKALEYKLKMPYPQKFQKETKD
ncbi:hypothetical protein AHAS_Ahas12G0151100 [Arachis hypogaea]